MPVALLPLCSPVPRTQPAPQPRNRLLLADDDRDFRCLISMVLARHGYEVRCADNGAEAVAVALEMRPDIALLNNLMPRMSGIEACSRLRWVPALDGLPIVVYSACPPEHFIPAALAAGAWSCWPTPMDCREFVRRTAAVLSGKERDPKSLRRALP